MKQFNDFDDFRYWFNKMFSLCLNGRFVGLLRLAEYGISWQRFAYKLYKLFNGYYRKPVSDVICIRMRGVVLKLYNR